MRAKHKRPEVRSQLPRYIQAFKFRAEGSRYCYLEMDLAYSCYSLLCSANVNKLKAEKYEMQTQDNTMVNSLIQRGTFCPKPALNSTLSIANRLQEKKILMVLSDTKVILCLLDTTAWQSQDRTITAWHRH